MRQATCASCVYYRQHYTFDRRKIFQIYCGHCTYKRAKTKRPDAKACENYMQADPTEKTFVTKEYLSKALLDYMLKLELLPEIYTAEDKKEISAQTNVQLDTGDRT